MNSYLVFIFFTRNNIKRWGFEKNPHFWFYYINHSHKDRIPCFLPIVHRWHWQLWYQVYWDSCKSLLYPQGSANVRDSTPRNNEDISFSSLSCHVKSNSVDYCDYSNCSANHKRVCSRLNGINLRIACKVIDGISTLAVFVLSESFSASLVTFSKTLELSAPSS